MDNSNVKNIVFDKNYNPEDITESDSDSNDENNIDMEELKINSENENSNNSQQDEEEDNQENENDSNSEENQNNQKNVNNDETEETENSQSNDENDPENIKGEITKQNNGNNNSNEEIKSIVFTNRSGNNSNNNIENIFFNSVNNENVNKFMEDTQNVVIEEEVAIKDEHLIYRDDYIYLKDLENQLLAEYPVSRQSEKYVQLLVEREAKKIILAKNLGMKKNDMLEKDIEYELINDMINDKFKSDIILPIVADKHKIYIKLKEGNDGDGDEEEDANANAQGSQNAYFTESLENEAGIVEENQANQMALLKELYHKKVLQNIDYNKFLFEYNLITKSHIPNYEYQGIYKKTRNNMLVLRYFDLGTDFWNTYNIATDYINKKDVFDERGKIKGIEDNILIKGDELNIIGFLLLSQNCDDLKKNFRRCGTITKISCTKEGIVVEIPNHGLKRDDIIYLGETNCYPPINNIFSKSVEILDNDKIRLKVNIELIKDGDVGNLYVLSKLRYDLYNISKNNEILDINFKESTYQTDLKIEQKNKNKVFLFNNANINKNDYQNIIKTILPSLDEIIEEKANLLKNVYTFDDVDNVLSKYNLTINDLSISQIKTIKDIFAVNLEKLKNEPTKNITLNLSKIDRNKFDSDYYLADKYITDKDVEQYYGKYKHFRKPEDNFILRLQWIESMRDFGNYYYLNYLSKQSFTIEKKYIDNKQKELTAMLDNLEKSFKKEKNANNNKQHRLFKYDAFVITNDNMKPNLPDGSVVFYKDNLYVWKGKMIPFEKEEEGTLALAGDQLWFWKKGEWHKSNAVPKYDKMAYVCTLNNLELDKIKLDSLDCVYRKDIGCHTKTYVKLENEINKIKEYINKFNELELFFNKNKTYLEEQIEATIYKYFSGVIPLEDDVRKNNDIKNKKNKKNENLTTDDTNKNKNKTNKLDALSFLLNLVEGIENNNVKLNYIFDMIDKDGMIINNELYSKKYKRKMDLCGHYIYFKKINYANSPAEKNRLIDDMLNEYGDNGETEKNLSVCKKCGEILSNGDYDETEGFAESGMIKKSREIWEVEKTVDESDKIDLFQYMKLSNIDEKFFKEMLLQQGLSIDDVDEAIKISVFIVKNLFSKSGVQLENEDIINIIIDSMQKIKYIVPYNIYRNKEMKKLIDKGLPKVEVEKMDTLNYFKEGYERFYRIKKNSFIIARFLIAVQTVIPNISRSSKTTICPFYSFDGDEGLTYMACLAHEMNFVILKDKSKSMDIFKVSITDAYNDFKKLVHVKELFKAKSKYELELQKKREELKFKDETADKNKMELKEVSKLPDNFETELKKYAKDNDSDAVSKMHTHVINRIIYLSKKIKETIFEVITRSPLSDIYVGILETSCCTEEAIQYISFYLYFELESNSNIRDNINEANLLYGYLKYFISIGSIHKCVLYDPTRFCGIHNYAIVDDEKNVSDNLMKALFDIYVDSGIYAGTLRDYIGTVENQIDAKTGRSRNEILSKKYTLDEYKKLLEEIESRNIKLYTHIDNTIFQRNQLNSMKKISYDKLDSEIQLLIKNITTILNKDSKFCEKYLALLRNFGRFEQDPLEASSANKNNSMTEKQKIKKRELINKKRIDYIKKFYITKLKKYISLIKNSDDEKEDTNIHIKFADSDAIAIEMQSIIYTENQKLVPFFNPEIKKYFNDLELLYTNEEINSINGMDNIYDSKYQNIKVYSDFNFNDASHVLLHMLISNLNKLILCNLQGVKSKKSTKTETSLDDNMIDATIDTKIDDSSSQCKYICNFIVVLLEELENDNQMFNLCSDQVEKIKNSITHDIIEAKIKLYFKEDDTDYMLQKMQKTKKSILIDHVDEDVDTQMNEYGDELQEAEKLEHIYEKGKKELMEKYGVAPTEDQLEDYKEKYLQEMNEEDEIEAEIYNYEKQPKGDMTVSEIMDKGADYGTLAEQDFEDGDGFDYSEQMVD